MEVSGGTSSSASPTIRQKAQETAQEFEAVFLGQMTKTMMESTQVDDQFGGGHAEEMYRGMMAEQLGNSIAKAGGVGIAPSVMTQILKMQGAE